MWSEYTPDLAISPRLAAIGTFSVFRALAKQTSGTPELGFR